MCKEMKKKNTIEDYRTIPKYNIPNYLVHKMPRLLTCNEVSPIIEEIKKVEDMKPKRP